MPKLAALGLLAAIALLFCTAVFATTSPTIIDATNIRDFFNNINNNNEYQQPEDTTSFDEYDYSNLVNFPSNPDMLTGPNTAALQQAAAYSSIARCLTTKVSSVTNWSCTWCRDGKVPVLTDVYGDISGSEKLGWYVGYDAKNGKIVVVFKSTTGFENWIINLTFNKVDYGVSACSGCKVHSGFLSAYKLVRPLIIASVEKLKTKYGNKPVMITGHSQGGALSVHAALDFHKGYFLQYDFQGIKYYHNVNTPAYNDLTNDELTALSAFNIHPQTPQQQLMRLNANLDAAYSLSFPLYNFGSPRVGDSAFSDFFNKQIGGTTNFFRVTHRADTVPHVPIIAMGFQHVGNEVWFPEAGTSMKYQQCSTQTSEDKTCSDSQVAIAVLDHRWYGGYDMLQNDADCK